MRIESLARLYAKNIVVTVHTQVQHRFALGMMLLTFLVEPVVYLTVWTTIARQNGGTISGMSAGAIVAYFIVWSLVRTVNIAFSPTIFEWRIRRGDFNGQLLRPAHPIHYDLSWFLGLKVPALVMWLPIGAALAVMLKPELDPSPLAVVVFVVALGNAYVVRSLYLWLIGLVNFWTTRTTALFDLVMLGELVFSGRLAPMPFMPGWVRSTANVLPFYSTFGFPIDALVRNLSVSRMLSGLTIQLTWIGALTLLLSVVWRAAVRRYSAVGN